MEVASFLGLLDVQPEPEPESVLVDWAAVESWLDLQLPTDYKTLLNTYGPVDIGEFIWVRSPGQFDGPVPDDYASWLTATHRWCRGWSRGTRPFEPPLFHPAPGGLLAWGSTTAAHHFFWDTSASADPDQWPVVLYDDGCRVLGHELWQPCGTPMLETLAAAITTGLATPGPGRTLGPLPAIVRRSVSFSPQGVFRTEGPAPTPRPRRKVSWRQRWALTKGDGLAALRRLVPPPSAPHLGDGTWAELFAELGTRLPADYVSLMAVYGSGAWMGTLQTFAPLERGRKAFLAQATSALDDYRSLRDEFPADFLLPLWPDPGGFLPFADTIDGEHLGWLTEGEPDDWPLIVTPHDGDQEGPLEFDLIAALLAWFRGRYFGTGFAKFDEDDGPLQFAFFEPWTASDA